jgi:hypothetical protein
MLFVKMATVSNRGLIQLDNERGIMDCIAKDWYISSHCGANNSCVQTRVHSDGSVDVRNSNDIYAGTASFTREEWQAFISGAKAGEFDVV